MGLRMRKSIRLGKNLKINVNKKSISVTGGTKGLHHTISSTGKQTTTVGIPKTGIYYSEVTNKKSTPKTSAQEITNADIQHKPTEVKTASPKTYKVCSIIMLIIGVLACLLGIISIAVGGIIFLIIGIVCVMVGLNFRKKSTTMDCKN